MDVIKDSCSIFPSSQLGYVLLVARKMLKVHSFLCYDPPLWWLSRKEKKKKWKMKKKKQQTTPKVLKKEEKKKAKEEKNEIWGFGISSIYFKHFLLWSHLGCCWYFEIYRLEEYVLVGRW